MATDDELRAELERLKAENEALRNRKSVPVSMKVSEKGGLSVYGLGRFPVTLYQEQWTKLLGMADEHPCLHPRSSRRAEEARLTRIPLERRPVPELGRPEPALQPEPDGLQRKATCNGMAIAGPRDMLPRPLRWMVPLLLVLLASSCGDSGPQAVRQPDAGQPDAGSGNQLSVAGSYDTQVTLLPGNTCAGVTVADATTVVTQAVGASTLGLSHAGVSYAGTVDTAGRFQTTPKDVVVSPATYRITITGQFALIGFDATVVVEQTAPTSCAYSVHWLGTKAGAPNVIPG